MSETLITIPNRISSAVAVTLLVQTALVLIWAGATAERVKTIEDNQRVTHELVERTARVEEQVKAMRAALYRIESKLERED